MAAVKTLIGNIKGPQGATGATGTRGSLWYRGTEITGTSTTAAVFSGSGISSAAVNDIYLNISNYNLYQCTVGGAASAAKWVYIGNIKGATGAQGTTGAQGPAGATGASGTADTTFTQATTLANLTSGESFKTMLGKISKAIATLITHVTTAATSSVLGHVKLSNSSAITTVGTYALDATEKNASIDGTLANGQAKINSSLETKQDVSTAININNLYSHVPITYSDVAGVTFYYNADYNVAQIIVVAKNGVRKTLTIN